MSSVLFAVGCGDAHSFKLSAGGVDASDRALSDLHGSLVELARISSRCNLGEGPSLVAMVGSHMEFSGEDVTGIKSSCEPGSAVGVDIDLGSHHIVYDFSQVSQRGRFPDAAFEGFTVTDMYHSVSEIRSVSIDRDATTMRVPDEAVTFDAHSVSLNLAGMGFDASAFVKLDIVFESDLSPDAP